MGSKTRANRCAVRFFAGQHAVLPIKPLTRVAFFVQISGFVLLICKLFCVFANVVP